VSHVRLNLLALVVVVVVALTAAQPSWACAVCGAAKAENDWAFGVMTIVLSLLPPSMFVALVVYFVRSHKKNEAAGDDHRGPSIAPPAE
jgi:heme/copper-type cytochrome/quinol oxidase subunit 2